MPYNLMSTHTFSRSWCLPGTLMTSVCQAQGNPGRSFVGQNEEEARKELHVMRVTMGMAGLMSVTLGRYGAPR